MARSVKLRQGTDTEHEAFTGEMAEVTFDTTNNTIILHDGTTAGGIPMAKLSDVPVDLTDLTDVDGNLVGEGTAFSGTTYVVTVASGTNAYSTGNKYYITDLTGASPTVTLTEGETYRFDQSDSTNTGHPLKFSTTANGAHDSGSEYTTGVTYNGVPGQADAYTEITVEVGAPTLYYYCEIHSGMGSVAAAAPDLPSLNSSNTVLLVTATGASDNSIIDSSTNNHTVTTNGDAVSGTFSPYRSGGYSTYFDPTENLSIASDPAFGFGTGDFTIELWTYWGGTLSSLSGGAIIDIRDAVAAEGTGIYLDTSGVIQFYDGPHNVVVSSGVTITREWTHIALTRESGVWRIFINGTLAASRTSIGDLGSTKSVLIGQGVNGPTTGYNGYISDFRIVKGSAIYTDDFTPPTERLTAVTNTSLLTCHLPYISDGSTNDHSITVNGIVSTLPFAPYDYTEYVSTDHGGSVYFDGSGDNLVVSDALNLGTDDFTFEFWIYPEEDFTNTARIFISTEYNGSGVGWSLTQSTYAGYNGLTFAYGLYGSYTVGKFVNNYWLPQKQWTHVVAQRRNGTVEIYVNGVNQTLTTYNENSTFSDGADLTGSSTSRTFFNGVKSQVSSIRLVTGSYVYDGDFTPLTASLSSSAAELHITGTNASIIDKSQSGNRIQLIGGATGSNTESKFANSYSMYFDGSDDRLLVEDPLNLIDFSNGESYTLETWINATDLSGSTWRTICNQGTSGVYGPIYLSLLGDKLHALASHSGSSYTLDTRSDIGSSGIDTLLPNTWYHIAYTWDGSNYTFYVDGVLRHVIAKTGSPMTTTRDLGIGARAGDYEKFSGYIQDFRITSGSVLYTADFTPPTKSLGSNEVAEEESVNTVPTPMWSLSGDSESFAAVSDSKLDTNATDYVALHHPTGWGNSWGLEDGSYAMRNNPNVLNDPAPGKSVHIWSTDDLSEGMTYQYYIKFGTAQPTMWEDMTTITSGSSALYSYAQYLTSDSNYPHTLAWLSNGQFDYYTHSANGTTRLDTQGWLHFAIELQSNGRIVHYINGEVVVNEDASDISGLTNKANVHFASVNSWMTDIEVYTGGGIHNPDLLETPPGFTPPARKQA